MLMNGLFFPRLTASLGLCVLGGRELYRQGYLSDDGPNSQIREMGAYPLNIAELLVATAFAGFVFRQQFGRLLTNRKFFKKMVKSKYFLEYEKLQKDSRMGKLKKHKDTLTQGQTSRQAKERIENMYKRTAIPNVDRWRV